MTGTLWIEVVGIFLRYLAPAVVGAVAYYMNETDQARLIAILTSTEARLVLLATLTSLYFGVRAWLKKTRFALTAAAMPTSASVTEVNETAKTQAPKLSTPADQIPQLTYPNEPKE